jgi:hypothetical protein
MLCELGEISGHRKSKDIIGEEAGIDKL